MKDWNECGKVRIFYAVISEVAFYSDEMFYQITAYADDMPTLRSIISKHESLKLGELENLSETPHTKNPLYYI
ncbi:MAG: hypothetical protein U9P79_01835 [Candidatus Cloacimonadota bacterium]|nr:hypothetical protein [Candidatus Cloacimonadota bacterium]